MNDVPMIGRASLKSCLKIGPRVKSFWLFNVAGNEFSAKLINYSAMYAIFI